LKREVAIKILPEEFSSDPERISRFQREAEVLASLNQPNIAAIYDLDEAQGSRFLVLELVEGETLAERIQRGPIPIKEALDIAKYICEALEAAHEKGVVHRDLKPANVKITPEGKVKVLDFGLAKGMEGTPASAAVSNSPTLISMASSNMGMIMGTASYMSPEQAKGRAVDRRTDIFAFGCVLYEMLTGQPTFAGDDIAEILGRVVTAEPDWSRLPAKTPPIVQKLLRRALKKDLRLRLGDIHDVRLDIEEALSEPEAAAIPAPPQTRERRWMIVAGVFLTAMAALAVPAMRHFRETSSVEMRLDINTPSTLAPLEFALSPDGRYIVFVASGEGPQRLWLRALDRTDAQPIVGTEGARDPFWSADSRSIGFTATSKLQRIDIAGGSPQILANSTVGRGGTWSADGTILFSTSVNSALSRIVAAGGDPVAVTRFAPGQNSHVYPQFLPDGRHFLYWALGTQETSGIFLGSLDGEEPKRVAVSDSAAAYLASEMIAFVRGTTLMAQGLDLNRGELTGDPIRLADPVGTNGFGRGAFSISSDGRLAYRAGAGTVRQLRWYDRTGKPAGVATETDPAAPLYPELSPDGARVAFQRTVQGNFDVWLMDLARGGVTRFTFDPANDGRALWSPDGARIAFDSGRKGAQNLYLKPSSGAGAEQLLLETPNGKFSQDWSKDGRFLLYGEADPKTGRDLWALPMTGNERKPIPIVKTPFEELNGQFSPDGRWLAYESNESGRFEIVVQQFPVPAGKWQVSTGGGIQPRWRADGKELYFIAPEGKMMAASIAESATFAAGMPIALFPVTLVPGAGANKQQYMVSRDGRFLINEPAETSTTTPITLLLNWKH
jgi:eukaryotic-like serine/threonine-protein kinase